jgi:DNA-binding response OmpR family regulator
MRNSILLVEDELKTGDMLKMALESEGLDVVIAEDGNKAIEMFSGGQFDLIILDLKLPGMTGEIVLEKIREIDPYVEVLIYTNYGDPEIMQKLINLGVEGYVRKGPSADLWELVELVKSKLDLFSEDEREKILSSVPQEVFESQEEED